MDKTGVTVIWRGIAMCRVAERGVDKFEMCANCQCVFHGSKSCQSTRVGTA